jgi:hypothetical protein
MENILHYLFLRSYFAGLFWIAFGIFFINFVIKNPAEDKISQGGDMKGWAAGISGILIGILIIIFKALGKI